MAYDSFRRRVVLFGGNRPNQVGDTWEWDGTNWNQPLLAVAPPARGAHAMAYDPIRRRVVLFGGQYPQLDDTWEWDGSVWVQQNPNTRPPARACHTMAFDAARGRVLLYGGERSQYDWLDDLWAWDGTDWTRLVITSPGPGPRSNHAMAYDELRGRSVLFGANWFGTTVLFPDPDTWELSGSWVRTPGSSPASRLHAAMAYDRDRERVVLFGGSGYAGIHGDTHEWNGRAWVRASPASSPSPRWGHAMTYCTHTGRTLLFGGDSGNNAQLGDTWEWDGVTWLQRSPRNSPSPRRHHAIAYDESRQRAVLFGGSATSETWEWDGTDWSRRLPVTSPSARNEHGLAYDRVRRRVVLFGGDADLAGNDDTWEWDGTNWQQMTSANRPFGRWSHAMAYHEARRTVVVFGGFRRPSFPGIFMGDTWEWDGVNWVYLGSTSSRQDHAMVYDAARDQIVSFGWVYPGASAAGTIVLTATPATVQTFGAGCASSGTLPQIGTSGAPFLGNESFRIESFSAPASAIVVLLLGSRQSNLRVGPCTLHVDPTSLLASLPSLTGANGFGALPLAVPLVPSLAGLRLFGQTKLLDLRGPAPQISATAGLQITLGY